MRKARKLILILTAGAIGGFLAELLVVPFLLRVNFLGASFLTNLIGRPQILTKIEERTIVAPQADYFFEAISEVKNRIVAIQSFRGGELIRSGSGLILTRDGMIVTTNAVATATADIFQVISGGKILKGSIVLRDYAKNLVLLSVAENDWAVAGFSDELPKIASNQMIVGKVARFSKDDLLVSTALVNQVDSEHKVFKISAPYDLNLYGAALVNNQAKILGLIDFKNGRAEVILAPVILETLNIYLDKTKK